MRKSCFLLIGLLFTVPQLAHAQRFKGMEIFGGYAYQRDNLSSLFSPFYSSPTTFGSNISRNGWQLALTENATDWLGMTQQFSGFYGTSQLRGVPNHFNTFSILTGPRFYTDRIKFVFPFAHALFGYDQTTLSIKGTSISGKSTSYAMAFGGGADVRVMRHFRIRLFQVDYYHSSLFGQGQNHVRLSAGVVFRLGGPRY